MTASCTPEHCLSLDLSGKFCPQVVLEVADFVRQQRAGTAVLIISTDPLSAIDIPLFAMKQGHTLEALPQNDSDRRFLLTIRAAV